MTMIHELKTWTDSFGAVWEGVKTHDVRIADRAFAVGDLVVLREWDNRIRDPNLRYTGRWITALITYISLPNTYGLPEQLCVLSLRVQSRGP